ncbi:MAG TPA: hypothetical protein VFT66_01630 [Roseiflexaceae bacterium]|jgi:hypothetical protein|nr:hypothetical protein [Roseiflexaceae bacterium]
MNGMIVLVLLLAGCVMGMVMALAFRPVPPTVIVASETPRDSNPGCLVPLALLIVFVVEIALVMLV